MTEQYPNYEPSWPLQVFGQLYHDQGMKKWGGFYLSDHTAARQREAKTAAAVAARQRHAQMNLSDMMALAQLAIEKQLSVTAQSNTATYNLAGDLVLPPLIQGPITGYTTQHLRIAQTLLAWADMRWLAILDEHQKSTTSPSR